MNNDKQNEKTQKPLVEEGTVPPRIVMPGEKKGIVPGNLDQTSTNFEEPCKKSKWPNLVSMFLKMFSVRR